jgi:two-component system, OmpR family, response regulator CpxR
VSQQPILLVEDDRELREMMETALRCDGRSVVTATNGVEAYGLAQSSHPCLILLDLMMPVMSGEEFRNVQLADPSIREIPVIVVSAHHDATTIAARMNAVVCLPKPLDFDALDAVVRTLCAKMPADGD